MEWTMEFQRLEASSSNAAADDANWSLVDTIFWHPSVLNNLTAIDIWQLCKSSVLFRTWVSENTKLISKARLRNDTTDWYFPLDPRSWECSWTGIHHPKGNIHHLPSLDYLSSRFDVVASSGGLLLLKLETNSSSDSKKWEVLIVTNPLTRTFRVLPAADCLDVGLSSWNYEAMQAYMVVDEKANSYKVILMSRDFVCVYYSSSDMWTCGAFAQPGHHWGYRTDRPWGYVVPSAVVDGRLFLAHLEVDGYRMPMFWQDKAIRSDGVITVFEVDDKAGSWNVHNRCALRNHFLQDQGFRDCSFGFEIVECMRSIYAVIPAAEAEVQQQGLPCDRHHGEHRKHYQFLPLQFHILQLVHGAPGVVVCGHLRVEVPCSAEDSIARSRSVHEKTNLARPAERWDRNWFRCIARGSVIWVNWEEYLLQFDVVTGVSTTQILPDQGFASVRDYVAADLSYRPSFDMKP